MALIKCAECGREISDKAAACVHCGCPISVSVQAAQPQPETDRPAAGEVDINALFGDLFGAAKENIPTVSLQVTLVGPQTAATAHTVFVPEFNRTVRVNIPNSVAQGQTVSISAGTNAAMNGVNSPLNVRITAVKRMAAPSAAPQPTAPRPAPASAPAARPIADIEQKVKAFKRRVYIRPVISLVFSVYFLVSLVGLFVLMGMFPDGGAPELLMNVVGVGFSLGFLPVFYFKFLPYIVGRYPDPGFFKTLKIMRHLQKRKLMEKAVTEMETCRLVPFGDKMCLSDSFLFPKKKNGIVIPCDELLWVYGSYSHRRGSGYLMLGTRYWGLQCYSRIRGSKQYSQSIDATLRAVQERNPAAMVGEKLENRKKYFHIIKNK